MSGYNPPTSDPWSAIKQRQANDRQAIAEANRPGRTQTFQAVRKLWAAINDIRSLVQAVFDIIAAMPENVIVQKAETNYGLIADEWTTVAAGTIAKPSARDSAITQANGNATLSQILETDPGAVLARLTVNGVTSPETYAQIAETVVGDDVRYTATVTVAHLHQFTELEGPLEFELQLYATAEWPQSLLNTAGLTAFATFAGATPTTP